MHLLRYIVLILFCALSTGTEAQLGFDLAIKKPEPYENRELKAEKSGRKKLTAPRKFLQNTYTHYNYFFNANNKINEVIGRAKEAHKDDYSQLLSYYNYTLEDTKADKQQLDSVIYKAKTGIVMHDLRNEWIDDLYLLWGAAFFLQQEFDSAYQMFQFINYAFAPKANDGYYRYIGSRMDGGNARSIVTPEQDKFLKRLTTDPPSRNTAFIWQARTLTEANALGEAGSLMGTLRQDPAFPERLQPHLDEVQGYWYYKQGMWDSAAHYLVRALDNAQNRQERARWEYLAAQLFERSGKQDRAQEYYAAAIKHAVDPVLDVWARLNLVRLNKEGGDDFIAKNIAALEKMAKRERFADYRDVIYGMLARIELERGNPDAARAYMLKASKYVTEDPVSRNDTYLNLADLLYNQKQYVASAPYYDSLDVAQLPDTVQERVASRVDFLQGLVAGTNTIYRQDSLQKLAALPEAERTDALRKLARQIRRQRGLKEEDNTNNKSAGRDIRNAEALTGGLFTDQNKGEWYFYNKSARTSGAATFRQVWGDRPNVDNWRRASSAAAELQEDIVNDTREDPSPLADPLATGTISAETLLETLPITAERLKVSNDSIRNALFQNGLIYLNEIADYPSAIAAFEELRRRFPDDADMSEVLFRLQYAYTKAGKADSAQKIKQLLLNQYPTSTQAVTVQTGANPDSKKPSVESTKAYEAVYDMFIEGRFAEAEKAKLRADSIYQTNHWNPQLLYIESVYFIKQQEDSKAIEILNTLIQQDPEAPIAEKATTLIEVLGRRKEIEEELRNLQLDQPQEERAAVAAAPVKKEEPQPKPLEQPAVKKPEERPAAPPVAQKVAEQPKPATQPPVEKHTEEKPVAVSPEPQLPNVRRDTTQARQAPVKDAAAGKNAPKVITEPASKTPVALPKRSAAGYTFQADAPHYAVVILNKVDNIYGNEARNAFNRYNKDKFYNNTPGVQLLPLDGDNKLLLIGAFPDVLGAVNYVQQTKPVAGSQVVPWLKAEKYTFTVLSESNLEVLKGNPDLKSYQKFLESTPVKF